MPATRVGPFSIPEKSDPARVTSSPPPGEDVDTYQRRLAKSKTRLVASAAIAASIIGFGAYTAHRRISAPLPFTGHEAEPNDRAPEANTVPFGAAISGQIGRRLDAERSDRDFYRITVPKNTGLLRVEYKALPNIAPCIFVYRVGVDDPMLRYCVGQPGRNLVIPALRLDPGQFYFTVLQDREQYTDVPVPLVLENISDNYQLEVAAADPPSDVEIEPNDLPATAMPVKPGSTVRGKLAWMRDVDVFCAEGTGSAQFSVEDEAPRPRGAVLEVTPLGGPTDGVAVRVHFAAEKGSVTERDVRSPWTGPKIKNPKAPPCISLTLVRDVWSSPPLPRVAPAGDQEYSVHVESL
jgi:hypothetical protein